MDKGWRCQKYGPLGWLEALIKLIAIGVAFASISIYGVTDHKFSAPRIGEIAVMVIIGALFVAMIVHRILDQELFNLAFMIIQTIAHWMMTMIVFVSPGKRFF